MKIWTCGISPRSGSQNDLTQIKNLNGASRLSEFWNLFGAIHIIFHSDWRPWMKSCYIIMTGRQSNNQWSGGIAAHPAPKRFGVQKSAGKIIASMFWVQDGILFIDYLPRSETVNAEYYLPLLVQLKDFFKEKRLCKFTKVCFSLMKTPRLTGLLQPKQTGLPRLPASWPPTLFSGSGPVALPSVPWTENSIE